MFEKSNSVLNLFRLGKIMPYLLLPLFFCHFFGMHTHWICPDSGLSAIAESECSCHPESLSASEKEQPTCKLIRTSHSHDCACETQIPLRTLSLFNSFADHADNPSLPENNFVLYEIRALRAVCSADPPFIPIVQSPTHFLKTIKLRI